MPPVNQYHLRIFGYWTRCLLPSLLCYCPLLLFSRYDMNSVGDIWSPCCVPTDVSNHSHSSLRPILYFSQMFCNSCNNLWTTLRHIVPRNFKVTWQNKSNDGARLTRLMFDEYSVAGCKELSSIFAWIRAAMDTMRGKMTNCSRLVRRDWKHKNSNRRVLRSQITSAAAKSKLC